MSSMYWFYADGGSKLNINGGKFKSASTSNTIHSSSSTASLKIYGGWYSDMTKSTLENYVPYPGNRVVKHSWVEIVIDGTTYVYDPEGTWQFRRDMYEFTYGTPGSFRYRVYGRMN